MTVSSQKVIIPKGLVNPYETTIIEIPKKLQNKPAVVAKPKHINSFSNYSSYDHKMTGNQRNINSNPNYSKREEFANYIKSTISERRDKPEIDYKYINKNFEKGQEYGDADNIKNSAAEKKYAKYYYETINEEPLMTHDPELDYDRSNVSTKAKSKDSRDAFYLNSNPHYANVKPQSRPKSSKKKVVTQRNEMDNINNALEQMENVEFYRIQKDLKDFQEARRKLIFHATNFGV